MWTIRQWILWARLRIRSSSRLAFGLVFLWVLFLLWFAFSGSSPKRRHQAISAVKRPRFVLGGRITDGNLKVGGFATRTFPTDLEEFVASLEDVLLICHPDWHGIRAATHNQPAPVLEVPGIVNEEQKEVLTNFLRESGVKQVVVNGVPPRFIQYSYELRREIPDLEILFIFHGTLVQHMLISDEADLVNDLIQAVEDGAITKLGFVKRGVAPFISTLGVPAYTLSNFQGPIVPTFTVKLSLFDGMNHIGVFGSYSWIKNTIVQFAAACMVERAVIHVVQMPPTPYLKRCKAKIVEHGFTDHDRFIDHLSQMDVNLYISLSECYPMVAVESLAGGVPCITSDTNPLYDPDPFLKNYLVVSALDDPELISQQIVRVLQHSKEIIPRQGYLLDWLNKRAEAQWNYFLGRTKELVLPDYPQLSHVTLAHDPTLLIREPGGRQSRKTICFCTYELGLVTMGGTGIVVYGLLRDLTEAGLRVIILVDCERQDMQQWEERMLALGVPRELFSIYLLADLASFRASHEGIFLDKSKQFARGLRELYAKDPFDIVEFHEYAGTAYEIVRTMDSPSAYLPPKIDVVARIHGSLLLIDMAEAGMVGSNNMDDPVRQSMYMMERYVLLYADRILAPSTPIAHLYIEAFRMKNTNVHVFHPPMKYVLEGLSPVKIGHDSKKLLVYGKLQPVKGVKTVIAASIDLMKERPDLHFEIVFAGQDSMCPDKNFTCIRDMIPDDLKSRFATVGRLDRKQLWTAASKARVAVIASTFETFGMAPHELYTMGLPLLISDIPAFKDFFTPGNSFVFQAGNATSLKLAMIEVLETKVDKLRRLQRSLPPIDYTSPSSLYQLLGRSSFTPRASRNSYRESLEKKIFSAATGRQL